MDDYRETFWANFYMAGAISLAAFGEGIVEALAKLLGA